MTNNDSLSLFKLIWHGLIASWYLGFLAADVAPAAGPGSSGASSATGFVPLKLRGVNGFLLKKQQYSMLCMICLKPDYQCLWGCIILMRYAFGLHRLCCRLLSNT